MYEEMSDMLEPDVRLAAAGNLDAFARLVEQTSSLVCSITLAITRSVELSEDLAQEVYLATWQSLPKLREPSKFLPWLRKTARNCSHHAIRGQRRMTKRRLTDQEANDSALALAVDPRPSPLQLLISAEDKLALENALVRLPEAVREIISLYYREDQSVRAVATLLELREDVVKKRLQRAREALRKDLLEQTGKTLKQSAPGSTFTVAVITAVTIGAPGGATAAGLGLGYAIAGTGTLAKYFAVGTGALAGGIFGAAAFRFGLKKPALRLRNERDKKRLGNFKTIGTLYVLLAAAAMPLSYTTWHNSTTIVIWYFAYVGGMMGLVFGWYPRIMKQSLAAERAEDPTAAARQRREFNLGLLGAATGTFIGAIPVIWAVVRG